MVRWCLQRGYVAIPKSSHAARIGENADVYDFALSGAFERAVVWHVLRCCALRGGCACKVVAGGGTLLLLL